MNLRRIFCIGIGLAVGCASVSCQQEKRDGEPTEAEIAAQREEQQRIAQEKRERERAANRERTMERLRQEDMQKQRAKEREKARLAEEVEAKEKEAEVAKTDWPWIEEKMVARLGVIGTDMGTVRLGNGKVLKEVMAKGASSNHLSVYHAGGLAEVAYGDLPPKWRSELLYDDREAALVASGESLTELPLERLVGVRERVVEERRHQADEEAAGQSTAAVPAEAEEANAVEEDVAAAGDELLAKRREIAQRLNEEVLKLSRMKDAGFEDGHAAVVKQKALIAKGERALREADAAVMAERRRRVGVGG